MIKFQVIFKVTEKDQLVCFNNDRNDLQQTETLKHKGYM